MLVETIVSMLRISQKPDDVMECLRFIINLLQNSFQLLDADTVIRVIESTARILLLCKHADIMSSAILVYEAIVSTLF